MPWLRNLVKTGDSVMVTVPAKIARRWAKAGVVAVVLELQGDGLLVTPQVLVDRHYRSVQIPLEEAAHAGREPKP